MKFKMNATLKRTLIISGLCLGVFAAIGFVEKQQMDKVCNKIVVKIDNQYDNYFISENDIVALVTDGGRTPVIGANINDLPLKIIEGRIKANKFVDEAEVYKDVRGNLIIKTKQSIPIARVIQEAGPDAYIDKKGKVLPVSDRFTARVILIGGDYTKKLVQKDLLASEEGMAMMHLLKYIEANEFWKAQIAEIYIDENRNLTFYPQISKQIVEFGKAENVEAKFKKLYIFYKEILPQKGWNKYEKVNLKYHNQIVCE